MVWLNAVGVLFEVLGLGWTAVVLLRTWLRDGDGYSLWTGKARPRSVNGVLNATLPAVAITGSGENNPKTVEEQIAAIKVAVSDLRNADRNEARERKAGDTRLGDAIQRVERGVDQRLLALSREDTRNAVLGVGLAAVGALLQFVVTVSGAIGS